MTFWRKKAAENVHVDVVTACFEPLEDITVHELAYIVARLSSWGQPRHGVAFSQQAWVELPPGVKRHWRVV